jgi:hypothetical protein
LADQFNIDLVVTNILTFPGRKESWMIAVPGVKQVNSSLYFTSLSVSSKHHLNAQHRYADGQLEKVK